MKSLTQKPRSPWSSSAQRPASSGAKVESPSSAAAASARSPTRSRRSQSEVAGVDDRRDRQRHPGSRDRDHQRPAAFLEGDDEDVEAEDDVVERLAGRRRERGDHRRERERRHGAGDLVELVTVGVAAPAGERDQRQGAGDPGQRRARDQQHHRDTDGREREQLHGDVGEPPALRSGLDRDHGHVDARRCGRGLRAAPHRLHALPIESPIPGL